MVQLSVTANANVPFDIVYQDEDLLVVHKPAGVVTQPGIKHQHNSLLNGLFYHFGKQLQNLGKKRDFGLLHRLDRGTTGLVIVGLSAIAYDQLRELFKQRQIRKEYLCIVEGIFKTTAGRCTWPISEQRVHGQKKAVVVKNSYTSESINRKNKSKLTSHQKLNYFDKSSNKATPYSKKALFNKSNTKIAQAITNYRCITHNQSTQNPLTASLIHCHIETGRLHQIRAHMHALEHPILGDFEYAGKSKANLFYRTLDRGQIALLAYKIAFKHPITQEPLRFQISPPNSFIACLSHLQIDSPIWSTL